MPRVKKLHHVVLAVRDAQKAMDWYADVIGMEPVRYLEQARLGLLTFGSQHHDIGVMTAPEGAPLGTAGGAHIAFEIEGGMDELKALHKRLKGKGVKVETGHDFGFQNGFYFFDPDGNRLEFFYDYVSPEEARSILRTKGASFKPFDLEEAAAPA